MVTPLPRPLLSIVGVDHDPARIAGPDADAGHLLLLSTWLSPAFPIGGFSYSHGLETAIVSDTVVDAASLEDWVRALLTHGSGWCDALLLAEAFRAVAARDPQRLGDVGRLASAMAPSAERQRETLNLGTAFLTAVEAGWPLRLSPGMTEQAGTDLAYPVAIGVAAAARGLPLTLTLPLFLNSFAATLISVAVRLVPLGQTAGLRVLASLQPAILATAERAEAGTLDDLGSATMMSDIASMRHETLYSRIFRS